MLALTAYTDGKSSAPEPCIINWENVERAERVTGGGTLLYFVSGKTWQASIPLENVYRKLREIIPSTGLPQGDPSFE